MDISAKNRNNFELLSRFVNELGSKSCKKIQKENYNQESALVPSQARTLVARGTRAGIFTVCEGVRGGKKNTETEKLAQMNRNL